MKEKPGFLHGKHFSAYINAVNALKQTKKEDELERLLYQLVNATEEEARCENLGVAPWYYEQLAVLYRKQKRTQEEIAILERYANQPHAPGAKPLQLLLRLQRLKDK